MVVGLSVQGVLSLHLTTNVAWEPTSLVVVGIAVLTLAVVGYLDARLGAGPFEGLALASRPAPFAAPYIALQAIGAVNRTLLGADVGIGTVAVVVSVGPATHKLRARPRSCPLNARSAA